MNALRRHRPMLMWLPLGIAVLTALGGTRPLDAFTSERPAVELRTEDGRAIEDGPLFPDSVLIPGELVARQVVVQNSGRRAVLTLAAVAEGSRPALLWEDLRITVTNLTTDEIAYQGPLAGLVSASRISLPEGETRLALAVGLSPGSTHLSSSQRVSFVFTVSGE